VTDVLRGKEDAATVKDATFAFVVDAGMVMVLPVNAGLNVVNKVPVIGDPA
jgi:hypothetical protein